MNENKHIPLLRDGAHGRRFLEEHVDSFSSVLLPIKGYVPQDVFLEGHRGTSHGRGSGRGGLRISVC